MDRAAIMRTRDRLLRAWASDAAERSMGTKILVFMANGEAWRMPALVSAVRDSGHSNCNSLGRMADPADELSNLVEIVMLTRQHGVPADVLARLSEIAARLSTAEAETAPRTERLRRAAIDLGEAVDELVRGEASASDHLYRRAKGLARFLARGKQPSGR